LLNLPNRSFNLVSGESTLLFFKMFRQLEQKELQTQIKCDEQRILSEISLAISLSKTSNQIFDAIVGGGIQIAGMPAGSLSIYKPDRKELFLVSAKGFTSEFYLSNRYKVRAGGLTEHILKQKTPVEVPNIADHPAFNNPILLKEGIRSLIAIPLVSDQGPVGILYVDDFKPRSFSPVVIDGLKLLAVQATIAIQKQQAFEQIKTLSIRDPGTGLYNRRYLNEILAIEMDRAFRLDRPLSMILFDLDHFKEINDRFGHLTGDMVLKELALLFGSMIRRYDIFCRFGGDEMLILMADTDLAGAEILAERLRSSAAEAKLLPEGSSLTCSFGVHTLCPAETPRPTPDDFLHRADLALYEAKSLGRNRVFAFHPALIDVNLEMGQNNNRTSVTRSKQRDS
jgi:diguanylate cyclase (GGDEF)-like protein